MKRLEPYEGKLSRTVLRGGSGSNVTLLPDMLVQSTSHTIATPTDCQSGQPSGQRRHGALWCVTALNKAVPLIYNALASGEMMTETQLKWYRTSIQGRQEHYFTTTLEDATVTHAELMNPHSQDSEMDEFTQFFCFALSYRKITWDHIAASTSGSDDWRKPLEA